MNIKIFLTTMIATLLINFTPILTKNNQETKSYQKFIFINKTDLPLAADISYKEKNDDACYRGFPIAQSKKSKLKLKEFTWFEKRGLGLLKPGEKTSSVVEALMHHAANQLIIHIPNVGKREFAIANQQIVHDTYTITIFTTQKKDIDIKIEKISKTKTINEVLTT